MWPKQVSNISEVCLMCLAMTGTVQAKPDSWTDTENRPNRFQEAKSSDTKSKVYTNDDLSPDRSRGKSHQTQSSQPSGPESSKQKTGAKESRSSSVLDNYRDVQGHDRAFWQKKIRPLRDKLDSLDLQIQNLQQKAADTNATTGLKVSRNGQLHASQKDSAATLSRKMDDLKQKRTLVVKSIQEVEEDARKAQALPEWLR